MQAKDEPNPEKKLNGRAQFGFLLTIIVSISALIITFSIAVSGLDFIVKALIFLTIILAYVVCIAAVYLSQNRQTSTVKPEAENNYSKLVVENVFSPEIEEKLLALEEANTIFGASLKPSDMFRLVSNRINEIVPFKTSVIFLADDRAEKLKAVYSFGKDSSYFTEAEVLAKTGLVGQTFRETRTQLAESLAIEKNMLPVEIVEDLRSGIACPLTSDERNYGVLALYSDSNEAYDARSVRLLDAVAVRLSPLFLNSIAFERSLNNAMIDALTDLPNERALFFILENQIAESQRLREQRPLTVLSIDVREFNELNKTYGHATGDHILGFVAKNIKAQLRQMDFLARVRDDEFLAVLPTSSEETTAMIVERIQRTFEINAFKITDDEKISIKLHFGHASFITDGETTDDLLKIARIRRQEAKSPIKSTVLWFPKEYSN